MKTITKQAISKFKFKKTYSNLTPDQKQEVDWEVTARNLQQEKDKEEKKAKYIVTNLDGSVHGIYAMDELLLLFNKATVRIYIGTGKRLKGLYYINRHKL